MVQKYFNDVLFHEFEQDANGKEYLDGEEGREKVYNEFHTTLKNNRPSISTPISRSTVYAWMRRAGFSYDPFKKNYYVDNHEDIEVGVGGQCRSSCHRWYHDSQSANFRL